MKDQPRLRSTIGNIEIKLMVITGESLTQFEQRRREGNKGSVSRKT